MFYHCNILHDLWYMLGFTKEAGNFEGIDPVDARVYPQPVSGTANFSTPPDGTSPIMRMGLVSNTNRPTCCDPDVMYHEFMHGVTNRLVGGRLNTRALDLINLRDLEKARVIIMHVLYSTRLSAETGFLIINRRTKVCI